MICYIIIKMDLRVKADLTMLYDLRPETFGELIQ